jgi:hypothetical protein
MAPKATPLWDYFSLDSSQPHIARCNNCGKNISRGKEGAAKLINGGMIKESEGQGRKIDPKDETLRGTVPLFSLKNHVERKQFLKLVMQCSIVQCSAANYCNSTVQYSRVHCSSVN